MILPELLKPKYTRPDDLPADAEWNDGSELQYLTPYQPFTDGVGAMARGVDEGTEAVVADGDRIDGEGSELDGVDRRLAAGSSLRFRDRTLEVLHRPGHSPTDTVLWDAERGILLAADHLIKHISSNPLIALPPEDAQRADGEPRAPGDRPKMLETYLASMARTREMPASLVLSGHGDPIEDHAALIDERVRMHRRRADKIARLVEERPRTGFEVGQALWGNVAVTQAFLCLSEVLGHVDLLVDEGRVREVERGGVARFEPAGERGESR